METVHFKRWMIGLDLSPMDSVLVKWVSYLSSIYKPEKIYFLHAERDFEIPKYLDSDLKVPMETFDEAQRKQLETVISEHFTNQEIIPELELVEGKPFDSLIHWSHIKKIDLFIAGRKRDTDGTGVLPHRLSRKLSSSVLFIPHTEVKEVKEILVPIDFSEHSKMALQLAIDLGKMFTNAHVKCMHVYQVPTGYYKTGKTYEEFAGIMKAHVEQDFKQFLSSFDGEYPCTFHLQNNDPSRMIYDQVRDQKADLVVMGSKGQSAGAFVLLGSTTEKLIKSNDASLTLVIKKQGELLGLLEALKRL